MGQTNGPVDFILVTSAGLVGSTTGTGKASMLTAAQARTLLSVYSQAEIAAAYQPIDATLTALAAVTTAADKVIYATGADAFATTDLTTFGRSLIDDADAATARTTLGLGTMATQASSSYLALTGGTLTGAFTISVQSSNTTTTTTARTIAHTTSGTVDKATGGFGVVDLWQLEDESGTLTDTGKIINRWVGTPGFHRSQFVFSTKFNNTFYDVIEIGTDAAAAPNLNYPNGGSVTGLTSFSVTTATVNTLRFQNSAVTITRTGNDQVYDAYGDHVWTYQSAEIMRVGGSRLTLSKPLKLQTKTKATLPSAATSTGDRFQVTDSSPVAYRTAFSNGTAWYYEDGTAV